MRSYAELMEMFEEAVKKHDLTLAVAGLDMDSSFTPDYSPSDIKFMAAQFEAAGFTVYDNGETRYSIRMPQHIPNNRHPALRAILDRKERFDADINQIVDDHILTYRADLEVGKTIPWPSLGKYSHLENRGLHWFINRAIRDTIRSRDLFITKDDQISPVNPDAKPRWKQLRGDSNG